MRTYVVNLRRRPGRRKRMERLLPPGLEVEFTTFWEAPLDGESLDPGSLKGFGLFPWKIESDNVYWRRPIKKGEIGCAISHLLCWRRALESPDDHFLVLEDDVIFAERFTEKLEGGLSRLESLDRRWDFVYLGRGRIEPDEPLLDGIVRPGYSYGTYAYLLSRAGAAKLLASGYEKALMPLDEFLPAMYLDHPRLDVRSAYPRRLAAYAFDPPLVFHMPRSLAISDTERSDFVS